MKIVFPSRTAALTLFACALVAVAAHGYERSCVRVNSTLQSWNHHRPWQKGKTVNRQTFGVIVGDEQVLVPSTMVADATFIELERLGTGDTARAEVEVVDYLANLALLRCEEAGFLDGLRALSLSGQLKTGAAVEGVQFRENDQIEVSRGRVKTVEVGGYPAGVSSLLLYRIKIDLSLGLRVQSTPIFRKGRLAGLLTAYNEAQKLATAIPVPVIQQFLTDAEDGDYLGFPIAGFGFADLLDPALRRYAGLENGQKGVYVTSVRPGSPADLADLQIGDVIVGVGGFAVDKRGEYEDPVYGRLAISHLLSTRHRVGDLIEMTVVRAGETLELVMRLGANDIGSWPVEPIIFDRAPPYVIVGGFIVQELSRPFLAAWGSDWSDKAPRQLTRLERKQWDIAEPDDKFVIISSVLPSGLTIGYEQLRCEHLVRLNGQEIMSVKDVAEALDKPVEGFHHFEFADRSPGELFLSAAQVEQAAPMIQQIYGLPALGRVAD